MIVLINKILFCILVIIVCVLSIKLANYKDSSSIIYLALAIILGCISICCVAIIINQPTAMDVYKDKTKSQITYKGTIPIDSIVVFKNK